MNKIYTKRVFALASIFVVAIFIMVNASAISEQGLPGEIGDAVNDFADGTDPDGMFDLSPYAVENDDGTDTTDLPDGDNDNVTDAPTTTRAPLSTTAPSVTSPTTTANNADGANDAENTLSAIWIVLLLIVLAAAIIIAIAVFSKKK